MEHPQRRPNRLPNYNYSTPGAYFVTICTKEKQCILSRVVGGGALDAPHIQLSAFGTIVEKYILSANNMVGIQVDKYVIMPNHIHLLLSVNTEHFEGTSRAPSPTNAVIPRFISTLKRFCHKDAGTQLFQRSYHDHIIRSDVDYTKIWKYIDHNPARWKEDCFYEEV